MQKFSRAFKHNPDGSWTCIAAATLEGPQGRIQVTPGSTFAKGTQFMGIDIAAWLEAQAKSYRLPESDAWHSVDKP
jgi:hypothetical protein